MTCYSSYPVLTAREVVETIRHGQTVSFSGFTPAGAAKAVPKALAEYADEQHRQGRPFQIRVLTGASSGKSVDEDLARAEAVSWRAPYQSGQTIRRQINAQAVEYVDMHLSHLPQMVAWGFLGPIDLAVVEASEITADGRVFLTSSIGASPTYLKYARKVVIEINRRQSARLREMADIVVMPPPPHRNPIPIYEPLSRIGWSYAVVDPAKVIGIVENDEPDKVEAFSPPDDVSRAIGHHVAEFLVAEMAAGRIPPEFLPLQAGVGNVANGVMDALGHASGIPPFTMYSEVFQDSQVALMTSGRLLGASATALNLSPAKMEQVLDNIDFFASRIVLRPQEISNHPGVIRRLGVIALNTALEFDIYGNVNSSHLFGMDIVNGIGGSGEFTRNAYLSIFMAPSTAKGGKISAIVPMCPHVDNNEHSVQVVVTEQGLADLRGLGPVQRARSIINRCVHPCYRDYLHRYVTESRCGHIPHALERCFEMHLNLMAGGAMLPGLVESPEPVACTS
jgi:propionyl-CoA:succinyl-CoA transferase